jgi:hypothetical protein
MEDTGYTKQLLDHRSIGRRRGWRDTVVRPIQVIYWPNFVTRRRRLIGLIESVLEEIRNILIEEEEVLGKTDTYFHVITSMWIQATTQVLTCIRYYINFF